LSQLHSREHIAADSKNIREADRDCSEATYWMTQHNTGEAPRDSYSKKALMPLAFPLDRFEVELICSE